MRSGLDRQRLRMSLVIACIAGRFATGSDVSRPSVGSRVGAFLLFFIPQIFVQSLASCRRSLRRFALSPHREFYSVFSGSSFSPLLERYTADWSADRSVGRTRQRKEEEEEESVAILVKRTHDKWWK